MSQKNKTAKSRSLGAVIRGLIRSIREQRLSPAERRLRKEKAHVWETYGD